jgi:hypothetical protein
MLMSRGPLGIPAPDTIHYAPTREHVFRKAMAGLGHLLTLEGFAFKDYVLIDLGCGTGDVLSWAVKRSFGTVVGIEIDRKLGS